MKFLSILTTLLLLTGCDELRLAGNDDQSEPSHYLCEGDADRFNFVLTFDAQRGWYLNGHLKEAASEHQKLSMENLTASDFEIEDRSSSPTDESVKITLTVNFVTGHFRAWAYPDDRLPDFTDGQCASIKAVFDYR